MKVFLDTNVIITALSERGETNNPSEILLRKIFSKEVMGIISAKQITDIYYVLRKYYPEGKRRRFISLLLESFVVLSDEPLFFKRALESKIRDYEDACIDEIASTIKNAYLVTENIKDFNSGKSTVVTPKQVVQFLNIGV